MKLDPARKIIPTDCSAILNCLLLDKLDSRNLRPNSG